MLGLAALWDFGTLELGTLTTLASRLLRFRFSLADFSPFDSTPRGFGGQFGHPLLYTYFTSFGCAPPRRLVVFDSSYIYPCFVKKSKVGLLAWTVLRDTVGTFPVPLH
jgi:hypothetical protein